ncbi:uncharacterized protein LOC143286778 [Babylonia areolata]|uniref:uncharacterized protein LOC143286778 n=1 Tax=Babylonia areolata TaxID=304850 RepID=UPI003FD5B861
MASEVTTAEPEESECSVCHEPFRNPKLLPCGHLLCYSCLLIWMKTKDGARCPLCRDIIVCPNDQSKSLEDVASGFPTDLAMELILEAGSILSKRHNCCVCEDVAATSLCLNCKDMLCQSCRKVHGKLSFSRNHTVEDLSTMTAEKLAANYSSPCSSHPEEIPRLFCPTHGACICLLCATSKHRNCAEVKDLGEKTEESKALLKQLATRLTEGEADLDKAIDELDQHLNDTEKYAETAILEIEEMCDQLDALVKENRRQLKEQVVNTCSDVREAVKEGKNILLTRQTKLTTHRRVTERVRRVGNRQAITVMSLKLKNCVDELDHTTFLPEDAKVVSTFNFVQTSAMTHIKQELAKLGEVKILPACVKANRTVDFFFHDNHGISVSLSNNNRTASKSFDGQNGIVLSRDPLEVNVLYEVQIDKWVPHRSVCVGFGSMLVGVTTNPATMSLSTWSGNHLWPAWICPNYTYCSGSQDYSNKVGAALVSLGPNRRVGLALDSARRLHLFVDGQDQGIAVRNLPDPCYAMFDVVDYYEQITALPATRVVV